MQAQKIIEILKARKDKSAWDKGVTAYSIELIENFDELSANTKEIEKTLLNGADSWEQYSWGGCSLIYNGDIAERLCSPSEFKKCREGERRPNSREEWLDTQARALFQACNRIKKIILANK